MPYLGYLFFSDRVNTFLWRCLGVSIGKGSVITRGTKINAPAKLKIGINSKIDGTLRTRGGVYIGNNVEFVGNVNISTQKHDLCSPIFKNLYNEVVIQDECWLSINSIVLDGVVIKKGTVLAAGSVLTKSTEAWGVYAGVPAKKIRDRTELDRQKISFLLNDYRS